MKKYILGFIIGLGLILQTQASTMVHKSIRMLTGTYLILSNTTTTANYTPFNSSNVWFYSYAAGTNIQSQTTNAVGMFYPYALSTASMWPDMNADIAPNVALQVVLGYTNSLFTAGVQSPVMINTVWTNPAPAAEQPTGTNNVTITLNAVGSGDFGVPDTGVGSTAPIKSFTFTFGITNASGNGTPVVITTNLPTAFLQGLYAVYPTISVAPLTSSTNTLVLNGLNLVGWSP